MRKRSQHGYHSDDPGYVDPHDEIVPNQSALRARESEQILNQVTVASHEEREQWNRDFAAREEQRRQVRITYEKQHQPTTKIGDTIYCTLCGCAITRAESDPHLFHKIRRCDPCKPKRSTPDDKKYCRCCGAEMDRAKYSSCSWVCIECKPVR